ncbi:MAG: hypothetical protein J6N53_07900 [Lachnospiraceae bacterium]|nr:hypothetical protein [Lachnospiraceae bacterium]
MIAENLREQRMAPEKVYITENGRLDPEKTFETWASSIREKEKIFDQDREESVIGKVSEGMLINLGLNRYVPVHGKTRIVFEYDADAREGYRRIVTNYPDIEPIQRDHLGVQEILKEYEGRREV